MISLNIKLGGVQRLAAEANMVQGLSKAAANEVQIAMQERFSSLGGREFWGNASRGTTVSQRGDGAVVSVNHPGVRLQWLGGTVLPGKKGYGLEHIQEKRILHGFRPDEAAFIAVCAMKAAQSVKRPGNRGNKVLFDRFGVRAIIAKDSTSGNLMITGFVLDTEGGNKAVDSVAAQLAQHFYALDELSRIQEVGATLNRALARFEGIIKDNPHDWEKVVEWEIEKLKVKQNAKVNGTFMKAPNGADTNLTESQWLSVRTGAFKNWFGDWEKVARLSFDSNTVSIAQAEKHLRSLKGREISNEETGISVSINSNQRRELLNASKARRSHENGFAYHGHYAVVSRIDEVFKNAVYCGLDGDQRCSRQEEREAPV